MNAICWNQIRRVGHSSLERWRQIPKQSLIWRANENDPRKHDSSHEGMFYQMPEEPDIKGMFGYSSPFDKETTRFHRALGLSPVMVRKPALMAMDYMKKSTNETPNMRLLFYGDRGHGKTHTLVHLIHYLRLREEYFIVQVREIKRFTRSPRFLEPSISRPGRVDTPSDAAIFLQQFRVQNAQLIERYHDTPCSKDYQWSARETTKAGDSIFKIAEHGVSRTIHASDCVAVLLKELMLASDQGKIRLAFIVDNVKFLYREYAGVLKHPDLKKLLVDELTCARAFKKVIRGGHKGGIVIATLDDKFSEKQNQLPRETLGLEGWNDFDPCLPIHVPKYSRTEFDNCLNMYQDLDWLARPEARTEEARDEIRFVTGMNPREIHLMCESL